MAAPPGEERPAQEKLGWIPSFAATGPDEDTAWLAEAVGVPGTRTHADTEAEARDAAKELATEVAEIMREAASMSLDEFARWMDLDERQRAALEAAPPKADTRRSLPEWSKLLKAVTAP